MYARLCESPPARRHVAWRNFERDACIWPAPPPSLLILGYLTVSDMLRFFSRRYFLKRILKIIQKSDPVYGDRYSVDLELGLQNTEQSFRLSEHVYQKKGSDRLCFPDGIEWNKSATVYFILPVKDQGQWVYHFINELTVASLLTGDKNFHVMVVDFESQDIDVVKAFDTPLLRSRYTLINMTGKFYKTLALNTAVEHVPRAHDLLFLFDLHIDVPVDILDSIRKVSFLFSKIRPTCHRDFADISVKTVLNHTCLPQLLLHKMLKVQFFFKVQSVSILTIRS